MSIDIRLRQLDDRKVWVTGRIYAVEPHRLSATILICSNFRGIERFYRQGIQVTLIFRFSGALLKGAN